MQIVLVCHPLLAPSLLQGRGLQGLGCENPTPFLTHSHPFNWQLAKNVIFGVAVVFPVVITFGVAGLLAGRHAQAAVQGFSRGHYLRR